MSRSQYDACVVGCGIIGSTTSLALAKRGLRVLVVEHDALPLRGSTLAGFGALTPYSDPYFVGETALFAERSLELYRNEWLPYIYQLTGQTIPLSSSGLLQLFKSKVKMEKEISRFESDCIPNYRPKIMNAASVLNNEPAISQEIVGGLFHPEPWIDLKHYMAAIEIAITSSKTLHVNLNSSIQHLELVQSKGVDGELTNGSTFHADSIVICTGLDSFDKAPLRTFPIRWIRGDGLAVRTRDNLPLFKHNIYSSPAFISPRGTGEMLLGSTYIDEGVKRAGTPQPDRDTMSFGSLQKITSACSLVSNKLDDCHIERIWRGWRPASSDDYPILGLDPDYDNVVYAQAFLGLGITLSVAVGYAIADYIASGVRAFPLRMNPERFL